MKLVIWNNKSYIVTSGPTWEFENDPDWFATFDLEKLTDV